MSYKHDASEWIQNNRGDLIRRYVEENKQVKDDFNDWCFNHHDDPIYVEMTDPIVEEFVETQCESEFNTWAQKEYQSAKETADDLAFDAHNDR